MRSMGKPAKGAGMGYRGGDFPPKWHGTAANQQGAGPVSYTHLTLPTKA